MFNTVSPSQNCFSYWDKLNFLRIVLLVETFSIAPIILINVFTPLLLFVVFLFLIEQAFQILQVPKLILCVQHFTHSIIDYYIQFLQDPKILLQLFIFQWFFFQYFSYLFTLNYPNFMKFSFHLQSIFQSYFFILLKFSIY